MLDRLSHGAVVLASLRLIVAQALPPASATIPGASNTANAAGSTLLNRLARIAADSASTFAGNGSIASTRTPLAANGSATVPTFAPTSTTLNCPGACLARRNTYGRYTCSFG